MVVQAAVSVAEPTVCHGKHNHLLSAPGAETPAGRPPGLLFDSLTKHCDLTNADVYSNKKKENLN